LKTKENLVEELARLSPEELKIVLDTLEKRLEKDKQLNMAGITILTLKIKITCGLQKTLRHLRNSINSCLDTWKEGTSRKYRPFKKWSCFR